MSSESGFLKNYELVEPTIRGLYDSKLRLAILEALKEKPMRLADLRRIIHANAPNTSTKAKDLEKMGLIERVEGDFELTPYGKIVRSLIEESFNFYSTYAKFKDYFAERDLSGIPESLLKRLGDLNNSQVVLDDPTNVQSTVEEFYELVKGVNKAGRAIAGVMDPMWMRLIIELFKKSVDVKLAFTAEVYESLKKNLTKNEKKAILDYDKIQFFLLKKDPHFVFAVGDNCFDINFKLKNGPETCYMEADLMSFDPKAIKWGFDLFECYEKLAKPINIADYL